MIDWAKHCYWFEHVAPGASVVCLVLFPCHTEEENTKYQLKAVAKIQVTVVLHHHDQSVIILEQNRWQSTKKKRPSSNKQHYVCKTREKKTKQAKAEHKAKTSPKLE